jgi:hypothetical protein
VQSSVLQGLELRSFMPLNAAAGRLGGRRSGAVFERERIAGLCVAKGVAPASRAALALAMSGLLATVFPCVGVSSSLGCCVWLEWRCCEDTRGVVRHLQHSSQSAPGLGQGPEAVPSAAPRVLASAPPVRAACRTTAALRCAPRAASAAPAGAL